jgi:hypothetical protein
VKKKKRRREFVDRAVQGALVRRLIMHWFAFIIISSALGITLQALTDPFRPLYEHLGKFVQTNVCFIIAIACMTPVFMVDTVRLSNRFVGPILRLRRAMAQLNKGEQPKALKFRPHDFWQELAGEFNQLLETRRTHARDSRVPSTNEKTEPEHALNG